MDFFSHVSETIGTSPDRLELFVAVLIAVILGVLLAAVRWNRFRSGRAQQSAELPVDQTPVSQKTRDKTAESGQGTVLSEPQETVALESGSQPLVAVPRAMPEAPKLADAQPSSEIALAGRASISAGMAKTRTNFIDRLRSFFTSRPSVDQSGLVELEELLILSDVGPRCAAELVERVKRAVQAHHQVDQEAVRQLLKEGIRSGLIEVDAQHPVYYPQGGTQVFLVVGVNGVGKTTTVAKLASRYRGQGKSVLVVAADTFRAAAVQQLEEWSRRIGFELIKGADGAKPASVVFDGMLKAKQGAYDVVLIDTAGRLHTKANLMQELEGIRNSVRRHIPEGPHQTVLVVDGVSGQNALHQARQFNEAVALSGVVVTKLDGTPKGGIIIPIAQELRIPVLYVGVGEKADDLLPFSAEEFADSLFEGQTDAINQHRAAVIQRAHGADLAGNTIS